MLPRLFDIFDSAFLIFCCFSCDVVLQRRFKLLSFFTNYTFRLVQVARKCSQLGLKTHVLGAHLSVSIYSIILLRYWRRWANWPGFESARIQYTQRWKGIEVSVKVIKVCLFYCIVSVLWHYGRLGARWHNIQDLNAYVLCIGAVRGWAKAPPPQMLARHKFKKMVS